MITTILFYAAFTILAAFIDAIRIRVTWGKVPHINHTVSGAIGIAGGLVYFLHPFHLSVIAVLAYLAGCVGVRLFFYSPVLNLLRLRPLLYVDVHSGSSTDATIKSFWMQRVYGAIGVILFFILNHYA